MSSKELSEALASLACSTSMEAVTPLGLGGGVGDSTRVKSECESADQFMSVNVLPESERAKGVGESSFNSHAGDVEEPTYRVMTASQLGGSYNICGAPIGLNPNSICVKKKCKRTHRNGNAENIRVPEDAILIIKDRGNAFQAFISPMGHSDQIENVILEEWVKEEKTLSEWATVFMMTEMKEHTKLSKTKLLAMEDMVCQSSAFKTPKKLPKLICKFEEFSPNVSSKKELMDSLGVKSSDGIT